MQKHFQLRWLLNLGLLLAVIILALLALPGKQQNLTEQLAVGNFIPANVDHIRLSRTGKKELSFQKVGSEWHMQQPYETRADDNVVQQLLNIRELAIQSIIDNPDLDLKEFGLSEPEVSVFFNEIEMKFGDIQPVGKQRYAQLNNQVVLIEDKHAAQLRASSISYIDRQLIPLGSNITRLVIDNRPVDLATNQELVSQWQETKAGWLSHASNAPATGIAVQITLNNNATLHYLADKRDNDVVLVNPDNALEYHLTFTALDTLGINTTIVEDAASNSDQQSQ